ncbi:hypothetical protein ASPZODRAFT_89908 [Penicilliopsis zonata CBS 506.65]|uniref:Fido domain-containing protein n=1 Tax=Penicilliopsis zonata CBS 506.65 TaxID=1073090 RepID=A0A1L9SSH9_9EURO|nr:hypothetical protein ASPZODRAFT_89908 [Penicilliopsis zonata CBS 506.65]OJJ50083.1 hypothetical protein ASPZODRAFT_89908 [Penicilliopsis zonata CBS 506.65]
MDSKTRAYLQIGDETPEELFKKTAGFFDTIQKKLDEKGEDGVRIVTETLTRHLGNVIFGSNYIERAGLNLDETIKICERVFRGEVLHVSHIVRSRREVVQHALALQHIVTEMVARDKPLSEDIILTTHRILTEKIDTPGGASWREYSGKYRSIPVHAGSTNFVAPKFIHKKMQELIHDYNDDVLKAETTQTLDPFAMAAKYCNDFVMIHPFQDGNGRMCRLILNAILLKYAGVAICLGEHDESREEYLNIQRRIGERMEGSGELAALVLKKAMGRYRTLKQKLTGKGERKA